MPEPKGYPQKPNAMKNFLLATDHIVQAILLSLIVLSSITIILPLMLMIPLGSWQMGSALIKGLVWKSRFHLTYFVLAAIYCLALWAGTSGMVEINFSLNELQALWSNTAWAILFSVAIPLAGAIKYYKVSLDDCRRQQEQMV